MGRFKGLAGAANRQKLQAPTLTPSTIQTNTNENIEQVGPTGTRTSQLPLAPMSESRLMLADRINIFFNPGSSYANTDPQKGGAPGNPNGSGGISSQDEQGNTTQAGVPVSPAKLSYGLADWNADSPQWGGWHVNIARNANPNRPQVNPTPFNNEGPNQNTRYTAPGPWAAGVFIG